MKDYIYVDTDLATSYFAQINRGMISKLLSNETTSDTGTNNGGTEKLERLQGILHLQVENTPQKKLIHFHKHS